MKIYFAGAIRGGRDQQPIYAAIVDYLQGQGHNVLSSHVAAQDVDEEQGHMIDEQIFARDIAWVDEAELMVADVTLPSLGVGYEIAYASNVAQIPVLCIAQRGAHVSAMIAGGSGLNLRYYDDAKHAIESIDILIEVKKKEKEQVELARASFDGIVRGLLGIWPKSD